VQVLVLVLSFTAVDSTYGGRPAGSETLNKIKFLLRLEQQQNLK
jgi:hypothetical protein